MGPSLLSRFSITLFGFCTSFVFFLLPTITQAAALAPAQIDNGGKLYVYDTACQSSALRKQQAFIIPDKVNGIDELYLHFHGSENPSPTALCNLSSGYGLCGASAILNKDHSIRAAIILSMENKGGNNSNDATLTESERNCQLDEAKAHIASLVPLNTTNYTVSASGLGTNSYVKFLEQGFEVKQTFLFDGCSEGNCEKIANFKNSNKIFLYASGYGNNLESAKAVYQKFPTKVFALQIPKLTDINGQATLVKSCYLDFKKGNACNGNAQAITISIPTKYGIGQTCTEDSDCSNNLDCEDSNVDGEDDFCVCRTPIQCYESYNQFHPGEEWECLDGTGNSGASALHYCKSKSGVVKYPVQSVTKSTGAEGDLIDDLMRAYENTPLTESELLALIQKPTPKIKIPGLSFSDITIKGKLSSDEEGNTYLDIPFLGEFMAAVYNYLILIAGVICVIRIIVGGALYAIPDTSGDSKSSGLKMIGHALVGLMIAVTSYTILYLFNPSLVEFKNLRVFFVRTENMNKYVALVQNDGSVLSSAPGTSGSAPTAIDSNFHHSKAASAGKLSNQNVKDIASKIGIDQCILWSFVNKESGGNLHAIGHDENYASTAKPVLARRDFLLSGKRYSGRTFTPPASSVSDWNAKGGYAKLNNYTGGGSKILNDDAFQVGRPPDYGIDWRFSHGISFMQITIFPVHDPNRGGLGSKINGPNGPEWARSIYGRWYTVSDLLNPDTSIEAALRFITGGGGKASSCGTLKNAASAFKCLRVSDPAMWYALNYYDKCPLTKGMEVTDADRQKYCSGKYRGKGCTVK